MADFVLRCTWRRCREPSTWVMTAGTPGGPRAYAAAGSCDKHKVNVERRTSNRADKQPTTTVRQFYLRPPPTEDQEQQQIPLDI